MENPFIHPQPPPLKKTPPESEITWNSVIKDMSDRNQQGIRKYGVPLRSHNGRNHLIDVYQEALDLTVYLKSRILEDWVEPFELW